MSVIDEIRTRLKKELKPTLGSSTNEVGHVEMAISEIPKICEKRGVDWVMFGEDNLWPKRISDLKYGSAIHNAIISAASDLIAGDGFLINDAATKEESLLKYNSLTPDLKKEYDRFLKNPTNPLTIEQITKKLSFDLKEQGAYCYEVIYNNDFTKIPAIKYVDVKNIRAGKMENDKVVSYWYCRDWGNYKLKEFKPKEIPAYDPDNKESLNQLVYEKIGGLEYYGEPDYIGALTWVQIDFQMGIFHMSNLENGMNPSMHLQFYKLPSDETDKARILSDIRRSFVGANKTGKHMVSFSEGKELAPKYEALQTNNLDKQLIILAELCDKKILTGHKLTSPLLAGISISGQMGGNTEIEKAFKIYVNTRISPYSKMIANSYQKILDFNKADIKLKINPYNPFL